MERHSSVISVMVAVTNAPEAVAWYKHALGAVELWNLGSVAGLEIAGAPFFVGEPANNGWESPAKIGITSARIEMFCDDPDAFIARAVEAGANGSLYNLGADPRLNHDYEVIGGVRAEECSRLLSDFFADRRRT